MSDVQGFLAELTLDGNVVTPYLNDVTLARTVNAMTKSTMDGTGFPTHLHGLETGTLAMNGQVDTAGQGVLEGSWGKKGILQFELSIGDGFSVKAGTYAGDIALSDFEIVAAADDAWNFSMAGNVSSVIFTPPT